MADMMVLFDPGNCGYMNLGFPLSLYVLQRPRQAGGHLCLGHGDLLSLAIQAVLGQLPTEGGHGIRLGAVCVL